MTLNKLASKIAKLEGRKSQARIGDIREILGILSDIIYEEAFTTDSGASETEICLFEAGMKRRKKMKK